jgi:hypothetical protein
VELATSILSVVNYAHVTGIVTGRKKYVDYVIMLLGMWSIRATGGGDKNMSCDVTLNY